MLIKQSYGFKDGRGVADWMCRLCMTVVYEKTPYCDEVKPDYCKKCQAAEEIAFNIALDWVGAWGDKVEPRYHSGVYGLANDLRGYIRGLSYSETQNQLIRFAMKIGKPLPNRIEG